jgi:hypothetical protein
MLPAAAISTAFYEYDPSHSGYITVQDFPKAIGKLNLKTTPQKCEQYAKALIFGANNRISFTEFESFVSYCQSPFNGEPIVMLGFAKFVSFLKEFKDKKPNPETQGRVDIVVKDKGVTFNDMSTAVELLFGDYTSHQRLKSILKQEIHKECALIIKITCQNPKLAADSLPQHIQDAKAVLADLGGIQQSLDQISFDYVIVEDGL